jgi:hypothetical protein
MHAENISKQYNGQRNGEQNYYDGRNTLSTMCFVAIELFFYVVLLEESNVVSKERY